MYFDEGHELGDDIIQAMTSVFSFKRSPCRGNSALNSTISEDTRPYTQSARTVVKKLARPFTELVLDVFLYG